MSDLISRSELIENFRKCYSGHLGMENSDACMTFHGICNVINNTNTAYDVDKVVEDLELHSFEFGTDALPAHYVRLNDAIEIVKQRSLAQGRGKPRPFFLRPARLFFYLSFHIASGNNRHCRLRRERAWYTKRTRPRRRKSRL